MRAEAFSPFYEELRAAEPLYEVDGFSIVRCADSGLVFVGNPLSDEELEKFYSLEYFEGEESRRGYSSYEEDEAVLRTNFRELLARMRARLVKTRGLRLLDYGCAYGYFLDEARPFFESVAGLEISSEVAAVGRARFELEIHSGAQAMATLPAQSFDVITMWDVIEHLRLPKTALLECARTLRSGGELYLTTGDIDSPLARTMGRRWRLMNPPQHITYFSRETLSELLRASGFEVLEVTSVGKLVSLSFFFFILSYLVRRKVDLGSIAARLARKSVYLNLFDVMLVRARKV